MIMTTSTEAMVAHDAIETEEPQGGLFDRAFRRFVAAREARARIIAHRYLSQLSEKRLLELGFEPGEIRRLRAQTGTGPVYWG
jgi:hypothetical protein